jgi:potassium channel subfamily K
VSLYFAYTTLLTIGYGDFTPSSNAGKAFFVFWTLLAVPTLTILISNMGDTVIKAFKDLTMWVGSLTVLPGDQGLVSTLKVGFGKVRRGKLAVPDDHKDTAEGAAQQAMLDRLTEHVEEDAFKQAEEDGDNLERDVHFYHFILAKEIRQLMKDIDASPPKQYTYKEWTYYLRLVGEDERNSAHHRKPGTHQSTKSTSHPELGTANEGDDEQHQWSWLGIRSPLMGNKTEAEWLLHRLSATLELEMRDMLFPSESRHKRQPPISINDMRSEQKDDRSKSSSDPDQLLDHGLNAAEIRRRKQG